MTESLYCPRCKVNLDNTGKGYSCQLCARHYPVVDGIPSLIDVDRKRDIDGFDAPDFEFLFNMEQKHFWHIGRKEIILDILRRNVASLEERRMLEIGCGNGSVLAYLRQNGVDVVGGDIFAGGLKFCRQRARDAALYQIDALSLPFRNEFDIIGIFDVLEHIEDDDRALAEISQALKPRGTMILTVPAYRFLWTHFDERSGHKRRYGRMQLVTKLQRNGFVVKKISFFMFYLLPLLVAVRLPSSTLRKNEAQSNVRTFADLKTFPIANGVFLEVLRLEKRLMRHLNLPFGSSLLALAQKG